MRLTLAVFYLSSDRHCSLDANSLVVMWCVC